MPVCCCKKLTLFSLVLLMKFIKTYAYQPSYFVYLCMFAFSVVSILALFIIPMSRDKLLFIASMIVMQFLFIRSVYLKNKLMVGVNSEGICIWQSARYLKKSDQYLFIPWAGVNSIEIKQMNVSYQECHYLSISYRQGVVLSVASSSTYAQIGKDIDLEVISMVPSHKRFFKFYIPLQHIKALEATIHNYALLENKQDSTAFPKN